MYDLIKNIHKITTDTLETLKKTAYASIYYDIVESEENDDSIVSTALSINSLKRDPEYYKTISFKVETINVIEENIKETDNVDDIIEDILDIVLENTEAEDIEILPNIQDTITKLFYHEYKLNTYLRTNSKTLQILPKRLYDLIGPYMLNRNMNVIPNENEKYQNKVFYISIANDSSSSTLTLLTDTRIPSMRELKLNRIMGKKNIINYYIGLNRNFKDSIKVLNIL